MKYITTIVIERMKRFMKKFSFKGLAAVLAAAIVLTSCAVLFGVAADTTPLADEGVTEAETMVGENDSQYTPVSSSPTTSPHGGDYYSAAADMNHDMVLNSADARFILRLAAHIEWVKQPRYLPAGTIFGDIDENGKVNAADARWTLRVGAKLNTVPEVIEQTINKPVPTTTAAPTTVTETDPSSVSTTVTTTTAAPTTTANPLELTMPICEEFVVKMKSTEGVSYTVASDGTTCYVKSDDLLKGFSVIVDRAGSIYVLNEGNKEFTEFGAEFSRKILGVTAESVRDFVKSVAVPEFGVFDDCTTKTEIVRDLPMTVAERNGSKFYFFADGELTKISAKTIKDKATDFTVSEYVEDSSGYTSIPDGFTAKTSNEFIITYGLDFILNRF